jgi:hypothetical protein
MRVHCIFVKEGEGNSFDRRRRNEMTIFQERMTRRITNKQEKTQVKYGECFNVIEFSTRCTKTKKEIQSCETYDEK